ncbi:MAG: RES family NAD+ phosphorylase [Alphaproteobacteria bacterium]|nr:RES family NAD+ phosphorylase [Alphaproteobacteria bacterium]
MSSPIWTQGALWSERRRYAGRCWRLVEAQHRVATLKLVDTLAEQLLLEEMIEAVKPVIPPECRHLDYLLATPFRYGAPYPNGSRFRRAGHTPGVFYAVETPETAVAEMAFYRLLFFAESPATPWPANPAEFTAFAAAAASDSLIDLTEPPMVRQRASWTALADYAACQALADACRAAGIAAIRYESVRDPRHRANLALLTCRAFAEPRPVDRHTWRLHFGPGGVQAVCAFPRLAIEFDRAAFAADPRLAALAWVRHSERR